MAITDFLDTNRAAPDLRVALEVLREFKAGENDEEYLATPFQAWVKLEQLEEFLEHLVEGKPLREDTVRYRRSLQETAEP
jgi:hypothetical protein